MDCRICFCDIEEEGLCNISPFAGYPVCERCKEEISCQKCGDVGTLYYSEELGKLLCKGCLVREAKKIGVLHVGETYYNENYGYVGTDCDLAPVVEYLENRLECQEATV